MKHGCEVTEAAVEFAESPRVGATLLAEKRRFFGDGGAEDAQAEGEAEGEESDDSTPPSPPPRVDEGEKEESGSD
jgi:hypothetical protein